MSTKVLIVDDHPFTRAGVRAILETNKTIKVVGEAIDGIDAIKKVREIKPEIVVMDINMPNLSGIESTKEVMKVSPDVKIIALSIHSGEQFVKEMLHAGAVGYLLKDEAPEELLRAVKKVKNGEMFLSSGVTRAALSENKKEDINILQTKLNRPQIMGDYIVRQKIIDELENNFIKPLSVVVAGPGYGKSVTVSEWLEQSIYMNTWLSLDKEHNDFRTFMFYINASIEKIFPDAMFKTGTLLNEGTLPPFDVIFSSFINEVCNIEQDFVLVLDDFQLLRNKDVFRFFDQWLRFPPPNVHLSIITRRDPPLNINKLRNSGRMVEIRMDDLCFSDVEILELFKKLLDVELSDNVLKLLQDKTEGWVIGLRLVSMAIKDKEDIEQILQAFEDNMDSVSDYLISEVLSKQPEYIMEQLINSSVLNRFCTELIDEVIPVKNIDKKEGVIGNQLIQWLLASNMFLISLDHEQHWFRYHHLFQELLQNQLRNRRTDKEIRQIHNRAGKWFEKNDFIAEAIEHSIKAKNINQAIKIIDDHWEDTFDKDQWYLVEGWLKLIPEDVIVRSCKLLLVRLWIAQNNIGETMLLQ
jgi:LuxR family maltose regulon positive regulatory protein